VEDLLHKLEFCEENGQTMLILRQGTKGSMLKKRFHDAKDVDAGISVLLDSKINSSRVLDLDMEVVRKRDAMVKLRRDQQFVLRRQREQPEITVFRRGMRISGMHVICSLRIGPACVNGTQHWIAYDQVSSKEYHLVVNHRDVRGLRPAMEGALLTGATEQRVRAVASRLVLERKKGGILTLVLREETMIATKLRKAFDLFERDQHGCIARKDVLQVLQNASTEVISFLDHVSKDNVNHAKRYLDAVFSQAEADCRSQISWKDFIRYLSVATPAPGTEPV